MMERNADWLDRKLRDDAAIAIEDGGFTHRVMEALPLPLVAPYPWLRTGLIVGSTALGGVLATLLGPIGPMIIEGLNQLVHFRGFTPAIGMVVAMTVVLGVAGFVLVADE